MAIPQHGNSALFGVVRHIKHVPGTHVLEHERSTIGGRVQPPTLLLIPMR
jgi:hypothetical protein